MNEDEFDPAEQAEAVALARALERGSANEDLPEDALQMAALLRYSAGGGELAADREDAVLSEVLEAAERVARRSETARTEPSTASRWWRWFFGVGAATATVAVVLLWLWWQPTPSAPLDPTPLPTPPPALISSGLEHLGAPAVEPESFRDELGAYRSSVYDALGGRYE